MFDKYGKIFAMNWSGFIWQSVLTIGAFGLSWIGYRILHDKKGWTEYTFEKFIPVALVVIVFILLVINLS